MPQARVDVLVSGPGSTAISAAVRVQTFAAVPLPTVQVGVTAKPAVVAGVAAIGVPGAGDPSPFGVLHVAGASADYAGHPTIPDGAFRTDVNFFDGALADAISQSPHVLAGPHGYSGNTWPATYSATTVSTAGTDSYVYAFLNVKSGTVTNWSDLANGTGIYTDTFINTFINSVPSGVTLIFTVNHEPENDGTQPSGDGGTWEVANAPVWCAGIARVANLVAAANKPNVYFMVVHMSDTFPDDGVVSGAQGINGRVTSRWNCWAGMSTQAKARTIFAPDGYTKVRTRVTAKAGGSTSTFVVSSTDGTALGVSVGALCYLQSSTGTMTDSVTRTITAKSGSGTGDRTLTISPAFSSTPAVGTKLRVVDSLRGEFDGIWKYVRDAGWGVQRVGITEHTLNNDVAEVDALTSLVWRDDIRPYLRDLRDGTSFPAFRLAHYLFFNHSTGAASGTNGWVDLPNELIEAGRLAWELNTGQVL